MNKIIYILLILTILTCLPAFLYNVQAESKQIKEPVFNGEVYLNEFGDSTNKSIVLVHGLGEDASKIWEDLIPVLKKKFHVISFDLPGFGSSTKENKLYSPKNYSEFLKWIINNFTSGRAILIGHSLGGAICLYFSGEYPEKVERLIIVDAAGILHRAAFTKNIAELSTLDKPDSYRILNPLGFINYFIKSGIEKVDYKFMPEDISLLLESPFLRKLILEGNPQTIAGMALINTNFSEQLRDIRAPSFIIWGDKDTIAPFRTAKLLTAIIPNSKLITMEGYGHNPMIENYFAFNKIISDSIKKAVPEKKIEAGDIPQNKFINMVGEKNKILSGTYDYIVLINCKNIKILNCLTRNINIYNSWIEIENSEIKSKDVGLTSIDSVIAVTGTTIAGKTAIATTNSKIDLAGVNLTGITAGIDQTTEYYSTVVFSVSSIKSPYGSRYYHEIIKMGKGDKL